ncbi:MAG: HhH-GPD family protein [Candidatus Tyrphobacter sp.]
MSRRASGAGETQALVRRTLLRWFRRAGRSDLPWRRERSPYRTLVSEFMLQQTQVDRVVPIFTAFVERFPTLTALAAASRGEVLRAWRGLGYNARALRLHAAAAAVVAEHRGRLPRATSALLALPGIGAYTAAAIRAFGYDLDDVPLDVNLKRVLHRVFWGPEDPAAATSAQLATLAFAVMPRGRANDWNSALMDFGATICTSRAPKCAICPLRAACAAAALLGASTAEPARRARRTRRKAVAFVLTSRYARGRIVDRLRDLPPGKRISLLDLHRELKTVLADRRIAEVRALVRALHGEGLVVLQDGSVSLP